MRPVGVVVHAGGGDSLNTFRLDPASGTLRPVGRLPAGDDARLVEIEPGGKRVYLQTERGRPLAVLTYDVAADGGLTFRGERPLPFPDVEGVTQIGRHPRAPWLLVTATNASSGLEDQLHPIEADGQLGPPRTISREFYAFAWDRTGAYFYGLDGEAIFQHRFDAATGTLTPLDPPQAPGSAGRTVLALAEHVDGRFYFSVEESELGVYAVDPATGALTARAHTPNPVPDEPITWSAIRIHPSGHYLYVTGFVTGPRTLLVDVFAIDAATGSLRFVEREKGEGRHQVTSTGLQAPLIAGDWLLVGGQGTADELWGRAMLAVYAIQPDGALAPTGGVAAVEPAETARVNFVFTPK
jgi:6-phosphogluconolactonase